MIIVVSILKIIMIHESDTDLCCNPSSSLYPQKHQGASGSYKGRHGNDINEVLGDARGGGWWSNKNGEQRVCVTCAHLFPKAIVCTK